MLGVSASLVTTAKAITSIDFYSLKLSKVVVSSSLLIEVEDHLSLSSSAQLSFSRLNLKLLHRLEFSQALI